MNEKLTDDVVAEVQRSLLKWHVNLEVLRQPPPEIKSDRVATANGETWLIEYKTSSNSVPIGRGIATLTSDRERIHGARCLLVVAFMGEAGAKACEAAGVNWIDLSGNARVDVPGLVVDISGKANQFVRVGRPASLFSPKTSRVLRCLLQREEATTQAEICRLTRLDDGAVSKISRSLVDIGFAAKDKHGLLTCPNKRAATKAWLGEYAPKREVLGRFAIQTGTLEELADFSRLCRKRSIDCFPTGSLATWGLVGHKPVSRVCYVRREHAARLVGTLRTADATTPEESVLTIEIPYDDGVFMSERKVEGIVVVHPLQALLDLENDAPPQVREALELPVYGAPRGSDA